MVATKWNDILHDRMVELLNEGLYASEIAKSINDQYGTTFTRNAVIGRAHRKGLTFASEARAARSTPDETKRIAKRLREKRQDGRQRRKELTPTRGSKIRMQALRLVSDGNVDLPPDWSPDACTITELVPNSCRYPLGDPQSASFRYCGSRSLEESPYCARHHLICYRAPDARHARTAASVGISFGMMQAAE